MEKINYQIQELLLEQSQNDYISERINYLEDELKKLSIKERTYLLRSEEELNDIKQLERLGLKTLFKKVLGNLEEQMEKERQEYLLAVMQHKSILEEIEIITFECDLLKQKFKNPMLIRENLHQLIKKKEFTLKSFDTKFSEALFKMQSEIGRYKLVSQKINGLDKKAEASREVLEKILSELNEVKDWPPSGTRNYASFAKKKYIDRARSVAIQAKVRLEEFTELSLKIFKEEMIQYDLSSFEFFLDRFYSNLITDYVVKSQLEKTSNDIRRTLEDLVEAQSVIANEVVKYSNMTLVSEQKLNDYILKYGLEKDE